MNHEHPSRNERATPRTQAVLDQIVREHPDDESRFGPSAFAYLTEHARELERQLSAVSETAFAVPKVEVDTDMASIYVTLKAHDPAEDVAKVVQKQVAACIDYDAAGNLIGVEVFDVLPEAP